MLLKDLIDELNLSELNSANLGDNDAEGITPFNYEKVITYINSALTDIYTRYPLRIREVLLTQQSTRTLYKLDKAFAESNTSSTEPVKYLDDLADPFDNLLVKVEEVYNEIGLPVPLNDMTDNDSVFTPNLNTLQIPYPVQDARISVIYRSLHPRLEKTGVDVLNQEIDLPHSYAQVLINYVNYKQKSSFDGVEMQQQAALAFKVYENSLMLLESTGLIVQDNLTTTKLELRGWV